MDYQTSRQLLSDGGEDGCPVPTFRLICLRHDTWHLNLERLRDAFALSQLTVGADHFTCSILNFSADRPLWNMDPGRSYR
jgi:hypothetical protein